MSSFLLLRLRKFFKNMCFTKRAIIRRRLHESEVNSRRSESGLCLLGATFMKCTSQLVPLYLVFRKIRLFSFLCRLIKFTAFQHFTAAVSVYMKK